MKVFRGDSCLVNVHVSSLDSITIRDKYFYKGKWESIGTGTYSFDIIASGSKTIEVDSRKNSDGRVQIRLNNWITKGYPLIINLDPETGRCVVEPQPTGYVYDTYGMIMVADAGTYLGKPDKYISSYQEDSKTFELYMIYYVDGGAFGYGYEYFQLNSESAVRNMVSDNKNVFQNLVLKGNPNDLLKKMDGMFVQKLSRTAEKAPSSDTKKKP